MTFTYQSREYELLDHPYNATITNERAVEIPIARAFIAGCEGDGLEVGNVLGHYGCQAPRRIVDRYEQGVYVENCDVFDLGPGDYDWIVSISTIEHVRTNGDGANPWGAVAALAYMRGLLRDGGRMLVTVGLGQNEVLDQVLMPEYELGNALAGGILTYGAVCSILLRVRGETPSENEWMYTPCSLTRDECAYGPTHGANAVWIGEWGPT